MRTESLIRRAQAKRPRTDPNRTARLRSGAAGDDRLVPRPSTHPLGEGGGTSRGRLDLYGLRGHRTYVALFGGATLVDGPRRADRRTHARRRLAVPGTWRAREHPARARPSGRPTHARATLAGS